MFYRLWIKKKWQSVQKSHSFHKERLRYIFSLQKILINIYHPTSSAHSQTIQTLPLHMAHPELSLWYFQLLEIKQNLNFKQKGFLKVLETCLLPCIMTTNIQIAMQPSFPSFQSETAQQYCHLLLSLFAQSFQRRTLSKELFLPFRRAVSVGIRIQ